MASFQFFLQRLLFTLAAVVLIHYPSALQAGMFNLTPSVALKEEYNDNIFFSSEDENDDFVTTLSPGLQISEETERFFAEVTGRLDAVRYADNADLDATEQYLFGQARYELSTRAQVGMDAAYSKDFRPDRDILDTGLVQSADPR